MTDGNELLERSGVNTRFWQEFLSPRIIELKGSKCEHCGDTENLDVHHTRYDHQTIDTMLVLCRSCHKAWHAEHGSAEELLERYGTKSPDY